MRAISVAANVALAGAIATAQVPAHMPAFPGPPQGMPSLGAGLPPVAPIPPYGTYNPAAGRSFGRTVPRGYGQYAPIYGYPMFTGYAPPSQPNVVIVNNAPPEAEDRPARQPAPEPAKPMLREYDWSGHKEAAETTERPAAWTIALKDGAFAEASMLWVQDGRLFYLDAEGGQWSVALESVDRRKTAEANKARSILRF